MRDAVEHHKLAIDHILVAECGVQVRRLLPTFMQIEPCRRLRACASRSSRPTTLATTLASSASRSWTVRSRFTVDERRVTVDAHKETRFVMLTALRNLLRSVVHDEVDAARHRYAMVLRKPHGLL